MFIIAFPGDYKKICGVAAMQSLGLGHAFLSEHSFLMGIRVPYPSYLFFIQQAQVGGGKGAPRHKITLSYPGAWVCVCECGVVCVCEVCMCICV